MDWGTLFHLQVINQGEKAVSKKELGIITCLHWLRVSVPIAFFWYPCVLAGAALSANDKYVCEIFGKEDLCLI